ncbi:MAG: O-methyltransferase [Acidimicrobiales bacterium]
MFSDLPAAMVARMRELEERDERDRIDDTPRLERLRQVPPETGRLLAILCASAPAGRVIEIGTSAGYSTLWLALACRATSRSLTTFELLDAKVALARETFAVAGVDDVVELVAGDFLAHANDLGDLGFCFLDAEKDIYEAAYAAVVPRLVPGGLLVADNVISHQSALQPVVDAALADPRVDAVVVPIGKGELVCRRV